MLVASLRSTKPCPPGNLTRTFPCSATAVARLPTTGGGTTGPGSGPACGGPVSGGGLEPGGGVVTASGSDEVETWNGPAPPAGFVTSMSVTVTASPGLITSLQHSPTSSVAFEFERTPERVKVAPVVASWMRALVGMTVPAGAAIVIVPGGTRPPVEALGLNENESLTVPSEAVVVATEVTSVTCWG